MVSSSPIDSVPMPPKCVESEIVRSKIEDMSAVVEEIPTAVEQSQPPPAAAEEAAPKKKPRKPRTTSHPPYFQMIKEALLALNEKSGSSPHAIAKYMEEKHKSVLPPNFRKILGLQVKNCVANGKLIKIKASYKLSESGKKEEKKPAAAVAKKIKTKSKSVAGKAKSASTVAKSTKKKFVDPAKKAKTSSAAAASPKKKKVNSTPKKAKKATATAKPKQPKSIKSPAAKRAKRASAA